MYFDAGTVATLPPCGSVCLQVAGSAVLVIRTEEGLFACAETCTHEKASLTGGAVLGDTVECPLHGAVFNLRTGAVEFGPAEEPLQVYEVREEDGRLFINLPQVAA
jgi:3-phenylpropionate/trans-cinnamate dioxygenase ferredoxin subunit